MNPQKLEHWDVLPIFWETTYLVVFWGGADPIKKNFDFDTIWRVTEAKDVTEVIDWARKQPHNTDFTIYVSNMDEDVECAYQVFGPERNPSTQSVFTI